MNDRIRRLYGPLDFLCNTMFSQHVCQFREDLDWPLQISINTITQPVWQFAWLCPIGGTGEMCQSPDSETVMSTRTWQNIWIETYFHKLILTYYLWQYCRPDLRVSPISLIFQRSQNIMWVLTSSNVMSSNESITEESRREGNYFIIQVCEDAPIKSH